jgi:hypothetical protein
MIKPIAFRVPPLAAAILTSLAVNAHAATKCELRYTLEGWSAFYETSKGGGTIRCDNGQSARVALRTKGGGPTVGSSKITDGHGEFSVVDDIRELYGDYAKAEGHAGVVKSASGQVVTKGPVSLALSGTGRGVDLGVAFGKFSIAPVARSHRTKKTQRKH